MSQRISFKVHGRVQGVNYRSFAEGEAESRGLTGFVENDPAGHVAGEAQGEESKLQDYLKALENGPSAAKVSKVEHDKIDTKSGEKGFGTTG